MPLDEAYARNPFTLRRSRLLRSVYLVSLLQFITPIMLMATARLWFSSGMGPPELDLLLQYAAGTVLQQSANPARMQQEACRAWDELGLAVTLYSADGNLLVTNDAAALPEGASAPSAPCPSRRSRNLKGPDTSVLQGISGISQHHTPLSPAELSRLIPLSDVPMAATVPPLAEADMARTESPVVYARVQPRLLLPLPTRGVWGLLTVMGTTLILLALIGALSAWALLKPLAQLADATQQFGRGNLQIRLQWQRKDELGAVAHAFDEMADRLCWLMKAERELLANVSHELRTPLSRIRVALDIAEESEPHRVRDTLLPITEDLTELEHLVEDVLTTSRFELSAGSAHKGVPILRQEHISMLSLVEKSLQRFQSLHPNQRLNVTVPPATEPLFMDPGLMRRVIDNLLDNARKYSEPDAPIRLTLAALNGGMELRIEDRGVGIEAEDLPRLGMPFFRTDRSRTRDTGGVGLGLTLVRRIVEAHHGTLGFESQVGVGTTVRIWLPNGGDTA